MIDIMDCWINITCTSDIIPTKVNFVIILGCYRLKFFIRNMDDPEDTVEEKLNIIL